MIHSSGKDSRQSDNAPSISSSKIGFNLMIQLSIHLEIILDSQIGALSNDPMIHSSGKDSRQSDSAPSISSSQIGLYLIIQLSSQKSDRTQSNDPIIHSS